MDAQVLRRMQPFQPGNDVAVDFNDVQMVEPLQQRFGQGTQPRPDLDHLGVAPGGNGRDNVRDNLLIDQKMLAEAFARGVAHWRSAISIACSTATNRLPGSALPVPASSSAVPWSTEVRMIGRPSVTLIPWPKLAYLRAVNP